MDADHGNISSAGVISDNTINNADVVHSLIVPVFAGICLNDGRLLITNQLLGGFYANGQSLGGGREQA